jgi:hypothetical protein
MALLDFCVNYALNNSTWMSHICFKFNIFKNWVLKSPSPNLALVLCKSLQCLTFRYIVALFYLGPKASSHLGSPIPNVLHIWSTSILCQLYLQVIPRIKALLNFSFTSLNYYNNLLTDLCLQPVLFCKPSNNRAVDRIQLDTPGYMTFGVIECTPSRANTAPGIAIWKILSMILQMAWPFRAPGDCIVIFPLDTT